MTIEKRGSKYRITEMFNGKRYRITVDHKPTKKEAQELLYEKMHDGTLCDSSDCFSACAESYIRSKENVLSPTTIRSYELDIKRLSDDFKNKKINDIDQLAIQLEVNRLSGTLSPKSVRNTHGFISAVIKMFRPSMQINTTLPARVPFEPHTPTDEELKTVMDAVKGTRYEIPFTLGIHGLRRSEICAATIEDLDGNYLTINKAKVRSKDKGYIIKNYPKNETSIRKVYLSDRLAALIREAGTIYDGYPTKLRDYLNEIQKRYNLDHFRFHDLRGYYASMAHSEGIPDKYIQLNCGWKTDHAMKKFYMRAMKDKQEEMAQKALSHIDGILG